MDRLKDAARVAVTLAVLVCACLAGRWLWDRYQVAPWTRDGRVRADIVQVSPDVTGLVTEVLVHDNQSVRRGQVLFVIDRARYQLALEQAEATVASQRAMLSEAESEDRRNRALGDLVTTEATEQGAAKVEEMKAALQQAVVSRTLARLNLERTRVGASVDGSVTNFQLRPGDYLTAGRPALALVDAASLHVDGYFEETKLARVHVGECVQVRLMGVSDPLFGKVESIASGVEDRERDPSGDLLANVNPTFSWVRLPQRIPVRVVLDRLPPNVGLIVGRTATVTVLEPPPPLKPPQGTRRT
ncbi:MAG TPA: HlyD family secretion protein [Caulobacteraceae bacterium]|jgi:multidrug resistance efflux pump